MRTIVLLLLLSGVEGLPFGTNVLDMLDFLMKKGKETMGWDDPKKGAREHIREFVKSYEDDPTFGDWADPNLVMNGFSSRTFGVWDLSGSLSMGRIIPGTEFLSQDRPAETEILGTLQQTSGALVNIPLSITQAAFGDNPDSWKRIEKALPNFAKSISQSARWAMRKEERDRTGAKIAEFNWPESQDDFLAVMGRAAGFSPTKLSETYDRVWSARDSINYYSTRHRALTGMLNYAVEVGDQEKFRETLDRIAEFNKTVPYPEMQIQTQSITQSLKRGAKSRMLKEFGLPDQQKYFRLHREYQKLYSGSREESED